MHYRVTLRQNPTLFSSYRQFIFSLENTKTARKVKCQSQMSCHQKFTTSAVYHDEHVSQVTLVIVTVTVTEALVLRPLLEDRGQSVSLGLHVYGNSCTDRQTYRQTDIKIIPALHSIAGAQLHISMSPKHHNFKGSGLTCDASWPWVGSSCSFSDVNNTRICRQQ